MLKTNIINLIFGVLFKAIPTPQLLLRADCLYKPHIVAIDKARNILLMNSSITINPNDSVMFKPLISNRFISINRKSIKPKKLMD
jgi:hypothetical protein